MADAITSAMLVWVLPIQNDIPMISHFYSADYKITEKRWKPIELPHFCQHADRESCVIRIHHFRHRKTGPKHPLAVVRCYRHHCSFTIYPIGFQPYGRSSMIIPANQSSNNFEDTSWEVVTTLLTHSRIALGECQWRTACRQIEDHAQWIGFNTELPDPKMAHSLDMSLSDYIAAHQSFSQAVTLRQKAAAVHQLLRLNPPTIANLQRLLKAALVSGMYRQIWLNLGHGYQPLFSHLERAPP